MGLRTRIGEAAITIGDRLSPLEEGPEIVGYHQADLATVRDTLGQFFLAVGGPLLRSGLDELPAEMRSADLADQSVRSDDAELK